MVDMIDELRQTLPALFEGDEYQARRRQIDEGFRAGQEEAFEALTEKAREQNIAILRTPTGIGMAPMLDGKIVKPEVFQGLPEQMRKDEVAKLGNGAVGPITAQLRRRLLQMIAEECRPE